MTNTAASFECHFSYCSIQAENAASCRFFYALMVSREILCVVGTLDGNTPGHMFIGGRLFRIQGKNKHGNVRRRSSTFLGTFVFAATL